MSSVTKLILAEEDLFAIVLPQKTIWFSNLEETLNYGLASKYWRSEQEFWAAVEACRSNNHDVAVFGRLYGFFIYSFNILDGDMDVRNIKVC